MKRWRRAAAILWTLAPFVIFFLRDRRRWLLFGGPRELPPESHHRRADKLTRAIARLGPTFIKLAQVFSARADILPEPYLTAIGTLQDRVPADDADEIERVIAEELGAPVGEVFESFDRTPIAAASLGQVHRATLRPGAAGAPPGAAGAGSPRGEAAAPRAAGTTPGAAGSPSSAAGATDVVVKVLRPDVEDLVAVDLDISFRLLFVLNILFRNHHVKALTSVVREFSVRVREEMDFRREAEHMALFRKHFGGDYRVYVPAVHDAYTRRRVLVMEHVQGDKIDRLDDRFAAGQLDFRWLMETLTEIYLRMLLVEGFLHADPHPGNILVAPDGRIVFLDWGMVVTLSPPTRDRILRMAIAAARNDLDGLVDGMYGLGMIDPDISRAEIRDAAAEILSIVERMKELGIERVQELVLAIMDTFYTWPLQLPRELVYFFRAGVLLEGVGFRYDPDFIALDVFRPVATRMRGELARALAREPARAARGWTEELRAELHALREILRRAEREEFRIRLHPRDVLQGERFTLLQVRRVLLSIFALTIAIIAAITFLALRNYILLGTGLLLAFIMFIVVFLLPNHLLENPMRHARGLGRDEERAQRPRY